VPPPVHLGTVIKMVEIACPRCSSSEADKVGSDVFVCSHCQTRFIVDHGRAKLPDAHMTPAAAKSGRGPAVALALGGVVLIAALVLVMTVSSSERRPSLESDQVTSAPSTPSAPAPSAPSPTSPRSTKPKISPAVVAAPPPPSATLEATVPGKTSIGGHFWLATYHNTGTAPIGRPAIVVSLFDGSGARVGEERGYARRDYLRPGESTTVFALARKPPKYERAEVAIVEPQAPSYTAEPIDLQVRDHVVNNRGRGRSDVIGTVENQSDTAVDFVQLLVVGRNDAGDPVAFGKAFATDKDLAPGESSGFKVRLGTWVIEDPKTVEVVAFGRPGR